MAIIPPDNDYLDDREDSIDNGWGYWWLSDSPKSSKLCCKEAGDEYNTWEWFMQDMFFIWWFFYYYSDEIENMLCPTHGCMDEECHYNILISDNNESMLRVSLHQCQSGPTDDGTQGVSIEGSEVSNNALTISSDQLGNAPGFWMKRGFDLYVNTDYAVDFYNITDSENFFHFSVSGPTPGIHDSVIEPDDSMSHPTSYDSNVFLKPSAHGLVKFGEYAITQSATITGYIEIVTADGKVRKLAVIDDQDEYQEQYQPL